MVKEQLTFYLKVEEKLKRHDFFVSKCNCHVLKALDNHNSWSNKKLIILGPKSSGKTHLLKMWSNEVDAKIFNLQDLLEEDISCLLKYNFVAIDNLNDLSDFSKQSRVLIEEVLFYLLNSKLSQNNFGNTILMTTNKPLSCEDVFLKDLLSRLLATETVTLKPPDEKLINALFVKLFYDRQLRVSPSLINYISLNIERTFEAINEFVKEIDMIALREKTNFTKSLAKEILKRKE